MAFPDRPFADAQGYVEAYLGEVARAAATVDGAAFDRAARLLADALRRDATIYACGNGGSAAIANHLVCDCAKGIRTDTAWKPRVHSLSANMAFFSAIANDLSYNEVFAYQLSGYARPGDVLITISSSGNSENIVRAVDWARANGVASIAFTGFAGGRSAERADVTLHVAADNYGVVEDVHQSLMHALAQFLRQSGMPAEQIPERRF